MPTGNALTNHGKQIGDDIYEQYLVVRTMEIKSAQAVVKGNLMTSDADGRLTPFTAAVNLITNVKGIFQVKADVAAQTYHATTNPTRPTVQVAVAPSWILIEAAADVTAGDRVTLVTPTATTVTTDRVEVSADQSTDGTNFVSYIGRVYEVFTRDTSGNPKIKTAAGDLVVVMLGEL
jgi:hypothetical protein